jgi:hypothetical protein
MVSELRLFEEEAGCQATLQAFHPAAKVHKRSPGRNRRSLTSNSPSCSVEK